ESDSAFILAEKPRPGSPKPSLRPIPYQLGLLTCRIRVARNHVHIVQETVDIIPSKSLGQEPIDAPLGDAITLEAVSDRHSQVQYRATCHPMRSVSETPPLVHRNRLTRIEPAGAHTLEKLLRRLDVHLDAGFVAAPGLHAACARQDVPDIHPLSIT